MSKDEMIEKFGPEATWPLYLVYHFDGVHSVSYPNDEIAKEMVLKQSSRTFRIDNCMTRGIVYDVSGSSVNRINGMI